MIALLGTNVIVRFLTGDKGPKYKNLYSFFNSLEIGEIQVELKLIVLFQVIFVLKSFYEAPKADIVKSIMALTEYKGIILKNKALVRRMIEIWMDHNLDIVDCYLVACLEGDKQNILYSYDRDFDKLKIQRKEP